MFGIIQGVFDVGVTSNYSDYLQLVQLIQEEQIPATVVVFQIGKVSSGPRGLVDGLSFACN